MSHLLRMAAQDRPWLRALWHGGAFIKRELANPRGLPLRQRLRLLRRGFWSESYVFYGLDVRDPADYLPDLSHVLRCRYLNGRHWLLLEDKLWFDRVFQPFATYLPRLYGTIDKGVFLPIAHTDDPSGLQPADPVVALRDLLARFGSVVVKPVRGAQGRGVGMLRQDGAQLLWNETPVHEEAFRRRVGALDAYIASERIAQHPYAARIFPRTVNTVRVLTMIDPDTGEPFIAAAVHRFGTQRSFPTDNAHRGGVASGVELESGTLGPALHYDDALTERRSRDDHPDTGVRITGTVLPNWADVREVVLHMARHLRCVVYVGWDVAITDSSPGLKILEANDHCGRHLIQGHAGLLRNPRVRRFFQYHQVL